MKKTWEDEWKEAEWKEAKDYFVAILGGTVLIILSLVACLVLFISSLMLGWEFTSWLWKALGN